MSYVGICTGSGSRIILSRVEIGGLSSWKKSRWGNHGVIMTALPNFISFSLFSRLLSLFLGTINSSLACLSLPQLRVFQFFFFAPSWRRHSILFFFPGWEIQNPDFCRHLQGDRSPGLDFRTLSGQRPLTFSFPFPRWACLSWHRVIASLPYRSNDLLRLFRVS